MDTLVVICIAAAVVFGIIESLTTQMVCIWFGISAVICAFVAHFTKSAWITFSLFVVISAVLLILTRPLVKNKLSANIQPTNADRIIGKNAVVTVGINPVENKGQIKVDGQIWSAKSEEPINEGETVKIEAIEGVKAVVSLP